MKEFNIMSKIFGVLGLIYPSVGCVVGYYNYSYIKENEKIYTDYINSEITKTCSIFNTEPSTCGMNKYLKKLDNADDKVKSKVIANSITWPIKVYQWKISGNYDKLEDFTSYNENLEKYMYYHCYINNMLKFPELIKK